MNQNDLPQYASRAARALVLLQEARLREFVLVWRRAAAEGLSFPGCSNPDYASLDALLQHVLGASRTYVLWLVERLALPPIQLDAPPESVTDEHRVDDYVDHLLGQWRSALREATSESLDSEHWNAPWGEPYTADSMLEHAVMHPVRHAFQLEELLAARPTR